MKKENLIKIDQESFIEYNTALHELIVMGFTGNKKQKISAVENLQNKERRVFEQLDPATRKDIINQMSCFLIKEWAKQEKKETRLMTWSITGSIIFASAFVAFVLVYLL